MAEGWLASLRYLWMVENPLDNFTSRISCGFKNAGLHLSGEPEPTHGVLFLLALQTVTD